MSGTEYTYFVAYRYYKRYAKAKGDYVLVEREEGGNRVVTLPHPIKWTENVRDIERVIKEDMGCDTVLVTSMVLL